MWLVRSGGGWKQKSGCRDSGSPLRLLRSRLIFRASISACALLGRLIGVDDPTRAVPVVEHHGEASD